MSLPQPVWSVCGLERTAEFRGTNSEAIGCDRTLAIEICVTETQEEYCV
jgi:hypothetical protein